MAARTYLPTLVVLLVSVCNYVTKHRARILEVIGDDHATELDNFLLACAAVQDLAVPFLETPV